MRRRRRQFRPLLDRGPLRVMFVVTSLPVGGQERLLESLVDGLDRQRFEPEVCCLKSPGPLGEALARTVPVHSHLLAHKYDLRVLRRLSALFGRRRVDSVVTVGGGDKMFWGRIAARLAGVPVVISALHSTGWPDGIGRLNRLLTPLTDAFVGVAQEHGRFLRETERLPAAKVQVIPNGVDTERFRRHDDAAARLRCELGLPAQAPICGIVAALRPEKNHELFLDAAARVRQQRRDVQFLVIGDGPQREKLVALTEQMSMSKCVHFLGLREDIPELLTILSAFVLTSHVEANPVSILEAMSVGVPVVATRVGSVSEVVKDRVTGYVAEPGNVEQVADGILKLISQPENADNMGRLARQKVVDRWSVGRMVDGYQNLIAGVYVAKCSAAAAGGAGPARVGETVSPLS